MHMIELIDSARFVVDSEGHKKAGPFHCSENRMPSFPRRRESRWVEGHVLLV